MIKYTQQLRLIMYYLLPITNTVVSEYITLIRYKCCNYKATHWTFYCILNEDHCAKLQIVSYNVVPATGLLQINCRSSVISRIKLRRQELVARVMFRPLGSTVVICRQDRAARAGRLVRMLLTKSRRHLAPAAGGRAQCR